MSGVGFTRAVGEGGVEYDPTLEILRNGFYAVEHVYHEENVVYTMRVDFWLGRISNVGVSAETVADKLNPKGFEYDLYA